MLRIFGSLYRPFRGAGIKIVHVSDDYRDVKVEMALRWYNRNYVGTHFGGSLYSMTDPFYMLMLVKNLGQNYIVWDKSASIKYIKPGRTKVYANFHFTESEIQSIKEKADNQDKYIFDKSVDIFDEDKQLIASVNKTLYVKKKG